MDCFNFTWVDAGVGITVYFNIFGDNVDNINVKLFNSTMDQLYSGIVSRYDDNQIASTGISAAGNYCLQLQSHRVAETTFVDFNIGAPLSASVDPWILLIIVLLAAAGILGIALYWRRVRVKRSSTSPPTSIHSSPPV